MLLHGQTPTAPHTGSVMGASGPGRGGADVFGGAEWAAGLLGVFALGAAGAGREVDGRAGGVAGGAVG